MLCESGRKEEGGERGVGGGEAQPYSGVPLIVVEALLSEGRVQEAVLFVEGLAKEAGIAPGLPLVNRLLEGLAKAGEWALCQELLLGENEIDSSSGSSSSRSSRSSSSSCSSSSSSSSSSSRSSSRGGGLSTVFDHINPQHCFFRIADSAPKHVLSLFWSLLSFLPVRHIKTKKGGSGRRRWTLH